MPKQKYVQINELKPGDWFVLPGINGIDEDKKGILTRCTPGRAEVKLGSKPVIIDGEERFQTSIIDEWSPFTRVIKLETEVQNNEVEINEEELKQWLKKAQS